MKLSVSHHFDHPVEAVWAMVHDPDSHVAKFEGMGHRDLEVVSSEVTDTTLDLVIRRQVDIDVPSVARKIISPSNTVTSDDHWQDDGDGTLSGRYTVEIKGVPAETKGATSVVPDGDGALYTVDLEVKVKVPLVGEKIAGALRGQLEEQMAQEFAAGDAWLAAH